MSCKQIKKTKHILNNNIIKTKFNELISRKMDCMPVRNMCNNMYFKFNRKHKGKYNKIKRTLHSRKFDFSEFVFTSHTFRKVLTLLKMNNKHVKNRACQRPQSHWEDGDLFCCLQYERIRFHAVCIFTSKKISISFNGM